MLEHAHRPGGPCSIIGGHVVRLGGGRPHGDRALGPRVDGKSSFGEDAGGRLYVMSVSGPVYRLAPSR